MTATQDDVAEPAGTTTPSRRATVQAARDTRELPRRAKRKLVPEGLAPFTDQITAADALAAGQGELGPTKPMPIGMEFLDYVELVHWTGQHARPLGPGGTLRSGPEALLRRVGLCPEHWLRTMKGQGLSSVGTLRSVERLRDCAEAQGKAWVRGVGHAQLAAA